MRIAVSGTHRTGKSTLVEELARSLPQFEKIDEPYHRLEAEGHAFAEMPGLDDFELQLRRSIESIEDREGDCIYDRCPADFLAYLITHADAERFEMDAWLPATRAAVQRLDLIVFVPIEIPDRISVGAPDHPRLRRRVHETLEDLVLGDSLGFGAPVLSVAGTPRERARQVLHFLSERTTRPC